MPNTILNWNSTTNLPREAAGEISEMYIGAMMDEAPTPRPPIKRSVMNKYQLVDSDVPSDPIKKMMAIMSSDFLRPMASAGMRPRNAPITVPTSAIDMVR